jgi:hypothetical protein
LFEYRVDVLARGAGRFDVVLVFEMDSVVGSGGRWGSAHFRLRIDR